LPEKIMDEFQLRDGIILQRCSNYSLLSLTEDYTCLSSAIFGGGLQRKRHWLNLYVSGAEVAETPEQSLANYCNALHIDSKKSIGMMTAASMNSLRFYSTERNHIAFTAILTTGLSNARCAGDKADEQAKAGTINLCLISHQALSPAALVEALTMATEAKAAALQQLGVKSFASDNIATGTGTDTTAVMAKQTGPALDYVGKHTVAGELLAQACIQALKESLALYYP
jgi:adenosylcobinamide amidohydrolase